MYQNYSRTFGKSDVEEVFIGAGPSASVVNNFIAWSVPTWAHCVHIICRSSGSGGGGGSASAAGVAAGGGGGGCTGTSIVGYFQAVMLPATLYLLVGAGVKGGTGQVQGGAAATAGQNGNASLVVLRPTTNASDILLQAIAGTGGAVAQTGGTAGGAPPASSAPWRAIGDFLQVAGTNGGSGNATSGSSAANFGVNNTFGSPGSGGAGVNAGTTTASAGNLANSSSTIFNTLPGGSAGGGSGVNGLNTYMQQGGINPWIATGGSGGGSNTSSGVGGNGGNGGPCSGGGGGGGSNGPGSIGGNGGDGGPGVIIITCW